MNATNRGLNRTVLFLVGVALVAIGATTVAAQLWPAAADAWRATASNTMAWMRQADEATRIVEGTTLSWMAVALVALLLVVVAVVVVLIARLGGGRTSVLLREEAADGAQGAVTIRDDFASDAIRHSLAGHDEILASRVTAHRIRGTDMLHVSVTARQNTSPADAARTVTGLVDNLSVLTGREMPTLVSIHAGIRARLASETPRVN